MNYIDKHFTDYKPGDIIARCYGCGNAIFYSDEKLELMYWVKDADYETTGHRTPYCRDCAEAGVKGDRP